MYNWGQDLSESLPDCSGYRREWGPLVLLPQSSPHRLYSELSLASCHLYDLDLCWLVVLQILARPEILKQGQQTVVIKSLALRVEFRKDTGCLLLPSSWQEKKVIFLIFIQSSVFISDSLHERRKVYRKSQRLLHWTLNPIYMHSSWFRLE